MTALPSVRPSLYLFVAVLISFGCGGDPETTDPVPDAGSSDGWQTLIASDWSMAAGREGYWCAKFTLGEDIYVTDFRAINPLGTHHTVLTFDGKDGNDSEFPCTADDGTSAGTMVYASGVGSDVFSFPQGVAVKIPAGQQLYLNLHLFNLSDAEIAGRSGVEIKRVTASAVEEEAIMVLGGTPEFTIRADPGVTQTVDGSCEFPSAATVLDVWPHMHQLGTHMKVAHKGDVVHDAPFSFEEQKHYPMTFDVAAGDAIDITCSYVNNTGREVGFGDSSSEEMCFAGFYLFPKFANPEPFCVPL